MRGRTIFVILAVTATGRANAAARTLDQQFEQTVRPFLTTYCAGCHSGKMAAAQLDLKAYTGLDTVTQDYRRWALVRKRLTAQEMPPKTVSQPPVEARRQVIDWIQAVR